MSKPVSNDEVEDVLSSIRRLVSDDKRPLHHAKPKPANTRLVLTPALRVAEHELVAERVDAADTALSEAAAEPIPETWLDEEDHADYADEAFWEDAEEGRQAEDGAADEVVEAVAEERAAEEFVAVEEPGEIEENHAETERYDAVDVVDEVQPEAVEPEDEPGIEVDDSEDDAEAEALYARLSEVAEEEAATELSAKITALETAVGEIRQDWEPDDSEEDAFAGSGGDTLRWEDDVELDAHGKPVRDAASEIEEVAFDPIEEEVVGAPAEAPKVEEKPRENGRLHLRLSEEDRVAEAPEPSPEPEPAAAESGPELAGLGAGFVSDDAVLDEEALRDLVSDIVRSELQGALGERITRNVRKLVRREIHRALTAQELD